MTTKRAREKIAKEALDCVKIPKGSVETRLKIAMDRYEAESEWSPKRLLADSIATAVHAMGDDPLPWLERAAFCDLKGIECMPPRWHNNLCVTNGVPKLLPHPVCHSMDDKKYTLQQALQEMPIPNRGCTNDRNENGFARCQCSWLAEL